MNSSIYDVTNHPIGNSPPVGRCQHCGTTDKKLSRCVQCHIEKYSSRDCQRVAWPMHKLVCHAHSKKQDPVAGDIGEVADWSGKIFGELRGFRTVKKGIRILSHTGGFAIFLSKETWGPLDHQVSISFPKNENSSCWIADKESAFVKVDLTPSELEGSFKDYASDDLEVVMNKIEGFVNKNFFDNPQAYPDNPFFSHGAFKDYPNEPRNFRFRPGGYFRYRF